MSSVLLAGAVLGCGSGETGWIIQAAPRVRSDGTVEVVSLNPALAFRIPRARWEKSPVWGGPEATECPLTPGDAVRASRTILAECVSRHREWSVHDVRLRQTADDAPGRWLYLVQWTGQGREEPRSLVIPVLLSGETVEATPLSEAEAKGYGRRFDAALREAFADARDSSGDDGLLRRPGRKAGGPRGAAPAGETRVTEDQWASQPEVDGWTCGDTTVRKGMSRREVAERIGSGRAGSGRRSGWGVQTPPGRPDADVWDLAFGGRGAAPDGRARLEFRDDELVGIKTFREPARSYRMLVSSGHGGLAFGMTAEAVARSPAWPDPASSEPPLSVVSAVGASKGVLAQLVADPSRWVVAYVDIRRLTDRYYVVGWKPSGGGDAEPMDIPVLFSGETGEVLETGATE